jgi:hypothetical protein
MRKNVTSYGVLVANATDFFKDLTVCSGKTTITSCTLSNLYILDHDEENSANPIDVTLTGATTISGSIIFETGQGKVYKGPKVEILGEVIGGKLIKIKEK